MSKPLPQKTDLLQKALRAQRTLTQEVLMYQRLMEVIREDHNFENILKFIITSITKGLGFDRAGIFLPCLGGQALELALGINDKGKYEMNNRAFPIVDRPGKDAFSDIMFGHKKYFLSNNVPKRRTQTGKLRNVDPRVMSHAIVPLEIGGDKIIGLLAVDNLFTLNLLKKSDLASLMNFATQAGLAIESFRIHEQIRELTVRDGLTGVFNRRYFDDFLLREIFRCRRYDRALSLLLVDLDHFKAVNDNYGHLSGDAVLKYLAGRLMKGVRAVDTVVRMGGDEFAVIMPEVGIEGVQLSAERLYKSINEAPALPVEAMRLKGEKITVSMGIASFRPSMQSHEDLVRLADQSLYQAKTSGRNRIGELASNNQ